MIDVQKIKLKGYRLEKEIGSGSMGTTFLGIQEKTNNKCVIKIAAQKLDIDAYLLFKREIETISELKHTNILKVLDFGRSEKELFLVTEYMKNGTLSDLIDKKNQLSPVFVINLAIQVCDGLIFLYERNIVHRDIKPSNILLGENHIPKLGDFGLAKNTATSGKSGITAPGLGRGTLEYIPLEQLENAVFADYRSDIYAFGATLYHLLTGNPPYSGESMTELLTKILKTTPLSAKEIVPKISSEFDAVLNKMLEKRPENRYQNPIELKKDLLNL